METTKLAVLKKLVVMCLILLLISLIYYVQRPIAINILVSNIGIESVSYLKMYGTLFIVLPVTFFYLKLTNIVNKTTIFHVFNLLYIGYFAIFAFVLFPHAQFFNIDLDVQRHNSFFWILKLIENWIFSLHYVLVELWNVIMLGFIFWQTANQIFKIKEAHWVYPLLVAALIFRPLIFDKPTYHLLKDASIQESLMNTSYVAIVSAIMISILFWFLSNYIVQKNIINDETTVRNKESSLFQSLKIVLTSKYIWLLCGLISCYSITTGIIELITKNQARILYKTYAM